MEDHEVRRRRLRAGHVWEVVMAGEFDALEKEDDLSPHIALLSRIALAHELRPEVRREMCKTMAFHTHYAKRWI